jgi:hypothetical protein
MLRSGCLEAVERLHARWGDCHLNTAPRAERACVVTGSGLISWGNDVTKLLDLMKKLGSDAALAAEYGTDPEAVLHRAGVTDEERRAMLESDYAAVGKLTGLADGQYATNHTIKAYDK